jgi:hypothetical protein
MTPDEEKWKEYIIELGIELDSYQDGDARVTTFTFNGAQLQAFVDMVTHAIEKKHVEAIQEKHKFTKTQVKLQGNEMDKLEEAIHKRDSAYILMIWQHTLTDAYNSALTDAMKEITSTKTNVF